MLLKQGKRSHIKKWNWKSKLGNLIFLINWHSSLYELTSKAVELKGWKVYCESAILLGNFPSFAANFCFRSTLVSYFDWAGYMETNPIYPPTNFICLFSFCSFFFCCFGRSRTWKRCCCCWHWHWHLTDATPQNYFSPAFSPLTKLTYSLPTHSLWASHGHAYFAS